MRLFQGGFLACILLCAAPMALAQDPSRAPGGGETHIHRHDSGRHAAHEAHEYEPPANSQLRGLQSVPASRWPAVLLTIYCVLIIGASLAGGWLPNFVELSHNRMQVMISLIGGLMLGIGVFHMLPHALVELGDDGPDLAAYGMMAGLVIMFLLLRLFHFHHHGPTEVPCAHERTIDTDVHSHPPGEGHDHPHVHERSAVFSPAGRNLSWVGIFLGMTLHTLIDGLALGASVAADALHGPTGLLGLGTFLAVWLHKPLDAVSITSVMAAGGWSRTSRTVVNAGFSLICPAGAALFMLGVGEFSNQSTIVGCALAFSAGVFLCIALSDLLPEMEFHSHNRLQLTAALLAGVALAWAIGFLEPAHAHGHNEARHSFAD